MCSCMCCVELLLPHLSSVKAWDWTLERVDVSRMIEGSRCYRRCLSVKLDIALDLYHVLSEIMYAYMYSVIQIYRYMSAEVDVALDLYHTPRCVLCIHGTHVHIT